MPTFKQAENVRLKDDCLPTFGKTLSVHKNQEDDINVDQTDFKH